MKNFPWVWRFYRWVCLPIFAVFLMMGVRGQDTPLDAWVRIDDGAYRFDVVTAQKKDGVTLYQIHMVSQRWLDPSLVNRVEWEHWLTVSVPDVVRTSTGLLFIGGGAHREGVPDRVDDNLIKLSRQVGAVVTGLAQVPNQPLEFEGKSGPLTEDALIAYAWNKYLATKDPFWLPRLPMTKAAVKAMDTVTSFIQRESEGKYEVQNYVVAGASKRGWTTWTTAIVDKRVIGIAPIVIDMLNLVPSFQHHWEAYGFYAPAVGDYERNSIMQWRESKEFKELLQIVEPYENRDRLTLPKYLLNATGDQYFLPDSWTFYWNDLLGDKYLRYFPNADHSLRETDVYDSLTAFVYCLAHDIPLPELTWNVTRNGQLRAQPSVSPASVKLWQATNPDARDFRVESLGKVWTSEELRPNDRGFYRTRIPSPAHGWTAFLIEFTFEIEGCPTPIKMTTGTYIVPDFLPFDFETGERRVPAP